MRRPLHLLLIILVLPALAACRRQADRPPAPAAEAPAPTNRVDINPAVRQNLGITFARVERRNVARTLRVPGRFELLPEARREYRTMLAGRVDRIGRLLLPAAYRHAVEDRTATARGLSAVRYG